MRVIAPPLYLASGGPADEDEPGPVPARARGAAQDLPYRVEIWNREGTALEVTLAITASGTIGFAAYYEAMREYPDRHIVLRHRDRFLAHWEPHKN